MALTEAQTKARILMLVGDVDESGNPTTGVGVVKTNIDLVWDSYAGYTNKLRELLCRRDLINAVLSRIGLTVDTSIGRDLGLSVRKSDRTEHYENMLAAINKQIAAINMTAALSGLTTNAIGQLVTTQPVHEDDQAEFISELR